MFSLESPQRGDSNDYTQYTIFQYKEENHPKLSQICNNGICSKRPKNEFETAVVNEPSVFEPLKFYCMSFSLFSRLNWRHFLENNFVVIILHVNDSTSKVNVLPKCTIYSASALETHAVLKMLIRCRSRSSTAVSTRPTAINSRIN